MLGQHCIATTLYASAGQKFAAVFCKPSRSVAKTPFSEEASKVFAVETH